MLEAWTLLPLEAFKMSSAFVFSASVVKPDTDCSIFWSIPPAGCCSGGEDPVVPATPAATAPVVWAAVGLFWSRDPWVENQCRTRSAVKPVFSTSSCNWEERPKTRALCCHYLTIKCHLSSDPKYIEMLVRCMIIYAYKRKHKEMKNTSHNCLITIWIHNLSLRVLYLSYCYW